MRQKKKKVTRPEQTEITGCTVPISDLPSKVPDRETFLEACRKDTK